MSNITTNHAITYTNRPQQTSPHIDDTEAQNVKHRRF